MVLGDVLLWAAVAAYFKKDAFRWLFRLSALLSSAVVDLLTNFFVAPDFNYNYIYTASGPPPFWREGP